jgi:hypothetical protein
MAELELVEVLGAQSIAYFRIDALAVRPGADEEEADVGEEDESAEGVTAARPNFVAAFTAAAAAELPLGRQLPVAVDVSRLHFFDGATTGAPLR